VRSLPILADPQQSGAALLDLVHQGEVLVAFGILDLIDADCLDRPEMAVFEPPRHHIFHRLTDLVPAGAERQGGLLPRQLARPMGEKQHVGLGEMVLAGRPGQLFDPHPAGPAIDPAHAVKEQHHEAPERNEFEAAQAEVIVAGGRPMAARTHRLGTAARPHADFDQAAVRAQPRLLVDEARKVMAVVEEGDQPHARKVPSKSQVDWQGASGVTERTGRRG
jgi:hypothetical protein